MKQEMIEKIEQVIDQQLDFVDSMGVDEENQNWKETRESLKDYIAIIREEEKLAADYKNRRLEKEAELERERIKAQGDVLKTGLIVAGFVVCTVISVQSDKVGEFVSRTGLSIASGLNRVMKF